MLKEKLIACLSVFITIALYYLALMIFNIGAEVVLFVWICVENFYLLRRTVVSLTAD